MDNRKKLLDEGENKLKEWEVKSNVNELNLNSICLEIDMGNEEKGGINLTPYYQREYKFSTEDESLLIESLLAGIPIPTIYLASDTAKVPHISNVIDGHHRLRAVYRFLNNEFKLKGLKKYNFLNGKEFNDLNPTIQNKLKYQTSLSLQYIHVQNNPELEIEIFTRYNKGTNQLKPQEIRNVVFYSEFHKWVEKTINGMNETDNLKDMYHITSNRYKNCSIHGDLYVIFSIIEFGVQDKFYASTEYIDKFMGKMKKIDENEDEVKKYISKYKTFLSELNNFLLHVYYNNEISYPFSKELYIDDLQHRNYKFQTSIMMIMTPVFEYIVNHLDLNYRIGDNAEKIRNAIKEGFIESGFDEVTSSTTNPDLIKRVSNKILNKIKNIE